MLSIRHVATVMFGAMLLILAARDRFIWIGRRDLTSPATARPTSFSHLSSSEPAAHIVRKFMMIA
jgi:hypothetical protein